MFETDKNGNTLAEGVYGINGALFMNLAVFSTALADPNVVIAKLGITDEIGPAPNFDGTLRIDFAAGATAVGLSTVLLGPTEQIRVYDNSLALLGTFAGGPTGLSDFFGFVATDETVIGRIELQGETYAIEALRLDRAAAAVPEPGLISLLSVGLGGAAARRYRRR